VLVIVAVPVTVNGTCSWVVVGSRLAGAQRSGQADHPGLKAKLPSKTHLRRSEEYAGLMANSIGELPLSDHGFASITSITALP
jgi:hypothetical protein